MTMDVFAVAGICAALVAVGWWLHAWVRAEPGRVELDGPAPRAFRPFPGPEDDTDPCLPVLYTAEQARAWDAHAGDGGGPWPHA